MCSSLEKLQKAQESFQNTVETAYYPMHFSKFSSAMRQRIILLYTFCLRFYLINIYIFDYPDSKLSGLFTEVPAGLNNQGLTELGLYRGAHGTQILPIDWSSTHE